MTVYVSLVVQYADPFKGARVALARAGDRENNLVARVPAPVRAQRGWHVPGDAHFQAPVPCPRVNVADNVKKRAWHARFLLLFRSGRRFARQPIHILGMCCHL